MNELFIFGTYFSQTSVCASNETLDWNISCKIVKGDLDRMKLPIEFKQSSGRKWTDVLNPSSVSLYLISKRFIDLLEQNYITGWKSYPVIIFDKTGRQNDEYCGLSIIGRGGSIDYSKSEVYEKQLVPNGAKVNTIKVYTLI